MSDANFAKAMAVLDKQEPHTPMPNADHTKSSTVPPLAEQQKQAAPVEPAPAPKPEPQPQQETAPPQTDSEKAAAQRKEQESSRLAAYARREAALRDRERKAQEKEQQYSKELESLRAEINEFKGLREEVKKNPTKALGVLGTDYKTITERMLAGEKEPSPEYSELTELKKEFMTLRQQLEQERQQNAEMAKKTAETEYHEAVQGFKSEISGFVKSQPEKFKAIAINQSEELVYNLIDNYYRKTGQELPLPQACETVERHLREQVKKNLEDQELKAYFLGPQGQASPKPGSSTPRTLTNNMTSSIPSMLPPKTEADRMARAMARLTENQQQA